MLRRYSQLSLELYRLTALVCAMAAGAEKETASANPSCIIQFFAIIVSAPELG
jgi:hypothetical protein